ncbi:hypothetical protein G7B40_029255 [Aetokthonos hydrillicola Thurmond2011]|jgi:hypothetical protein|uniref:Type I restriction enzyme R protein N-terminal domain-containing protein n=1 Tax=Aetokthonos hydrillicola Thurmond2011 TaxID=2712845 RepID=A0AAP5IBT2_9CYAN|nr:hypothetical protein [Aetokthonos hydrillicola]MBO3457166.1 hypothetical protein [Aetokthonos hydrillicola CCALA 1050]MBW4587517.1 hypothetical protein [Aetokthonos hydrillicola CCALA 1050]MDR9898616.1 hypothetical protein [Aetokthonos hydrillicola Thurmond2011]
MAYSDFTVGKVKQTFGIETIEGTSFFPAISPAAPTSTLLEVLEENLPLAAALPSEKAKSELLISPILVEVRKLLKRQVSLFSGQDFTVNVEVGLSGICDFLISRSPEQLEIESPVVVLVEAKKADINSGMGQCMAEMVAAQQFNQREGEEPKPVYGCVSSGLLWRFLKLEYNQITVDLKDYSLEPISDLLGKLIWMCGDLSSPKLTNN